MNIRAASTRTAPLGGRAPVCCAFGRRAGGQMTAAPPRRAAGRATRPGFFRRRCAAGAALEPPAAGSGACGQNRAGAVRDAAAAPSCARPCGDGAGRRPLTVKSFESVAYHMMPNSKKSTIFSSGKPRSIPWWMGVVLVGLLAAVVLYNWR